MAKIMLVLENEDDRLFLDKVLVRLKYQVISLNKGSDLSEQLIDHFPDVVFASTLGKNEKTLNALGKIKEVRGKPKLVFVRQEKEGGALSQEQKSILDGILYSPVDPFKLIELLSSTTDVDIVELRKRYNESLPASRDKKEDIGNEPANNDSVSVTGFTKVSGRRSKKPSTQVTGDVSNKEAIQHVKSNDKNPGGSAVGGQGESGAYWKRQRSDGSKDVYSPDSDVHGEKGSAVEGQRESDSINVTGDGYTINPTSKKTKSRAAASDELGGAKQQPDSHQSSESSLINDPGRAQKYASLLKEAKERNGTPTPIDIQVLREKQAAQAKQIKEEPSVKENRKHFLKTLFSIDPNQVKNK